MNPSNPFRRLAAAALSVLLIQAVAPARASEAAPTLAQLRAGERALVVGGVSDFAPFNTVARDGSLSGLDREVMRAVAQRIGARKVEFRPMPFSQLGAALQDGTIDVIANNYWITPERQSLYSMTVPYYTRGGIGAMWRKGTGPFASLDSLAGKRVAVFKGTYSESLLRERVPSATVLSMDGTSHELDDALRHGDADVELGFFTRQRTVMRQPSGGVAFEQALIQPMQAAFALHKGNDELLGAINHAIDALWDDGTLYKIKHKYLAPLGMEPAKTRHPQPVVTQPAATP